MHPLDVPEMLRKTLFSTNPIESALSVVKDTYRRVKRWGAGDMKLRWIASRLLFAEGQFRRVKGYRQIPKLMAAVQATTPFAKQATLALGRKAG